MSIFVREAVQKVYGMLNSDRIWSDCGLLFYFTLFYIVLYFILYCILAKTGAHNWKHDNILMCRLKVLLVGGYLVNVGSRRAEVVQWLGFLRECRHIHTYRQGNSCIPNKQEVQFLITFITKVSETAIWSKVFTVLLQFIVSVEFIHERTKMNKQINSLIFIKDIKSFNWTDDICQSTAGCAKIKLKKMSSFKLNWTKTRDYEDMKWSGGYIWN